MAESTSGSLPIAGYGTWADGCCPGDARDCPATLAEQRRLRATASTGARSALYQLADVLVREAAGLSLHEWMLAGRTRLDRLTWPRMSGELAALTGGRVSVTTVTLRAWLMADLAAASSGSDDRGGGAGAGLPGDDRGV